MFNARIRDQWIAPASGAHVRIMQRVLHAFLQAHAQQGDGTMHLPAHPKAILIDLAGVLHVGDQVIPGSVDALARLRDAGLPLLFLTNTTRTPRTHTGGAKMNALGLACAKTSC
jgi:phosphoglycolate phosphatase-like HAD superfamily hydrolase